MDEPQKWVRLQISTATFLNIETGAKERLPCWYGTTKDEEIAIKNANQAVVDFMAERDIR